MKRVLFVILLLTAFNSFAQQGESDPEAKKVLEQVSAKYKSHKTMTAPFTFKVEDATGKIRETQSGTLYIKGARYKVNLGSSVIYSDGKSVWAFDKEINEVQITHFDPDDNTITPQKMFSDFYDKDFLYKLNEDVKVGNRVLREVELTPKDKTHMYFKILLHLDKSTKEIVSFKIFEKNGNRYIYTIKDLKANTPIADAFFIFRAKDHPGVEVVDLR